MRPSSRIVGTSPLGFIARYSGVLFTPNFPPASTRSYLRFSSAQVHSTFCTLTELVLPQIFSMCSSLFLAGALVEGLEELFGDLAGDPVNEARADLRELPAHVGLGGVGEARAGVLRTELDGGLALREAG